MTAGLNISSERAWYLNSYYISGVATTMGGAVRMCSDLLQYNMVYANGLIVTGSLKRGTSLPLLTAPDGEVFVSYSFIPQGIIGNPVVGNLCCVLYAAATGKPVVVSETYEDMIERVRTQYNDQIESGDAVLLDDIELSTVLVGSDDNPLLQFTFARFYG